MSNNDGCPQTSIGEEAAIALHESGWWEGKSHREIAEFQMNTRELCCPFGVFHEALEKAVGRPVFTHELGLNPGGIRAELFDGAEPPSFQEILDLIPEDKRLIVVITEEGGPPTPKSSSEGIFDYECPHCDETLSGGFGEAVYCGPCDRTYATDFDYSGDDSLNAWITTETPGRVGLD